MKCYKCGSELTDQNMCLQCGADVTVYKKVAKASNQYYNLGLSKAQVRDLSGAVESLRISLELNKSNIEARNMLGLVYCEMGNVVEALSQWVISKNLQPDKNIASSYITSIQSNQGRFDSVAQTIKKYNTSLNYAKEGNYDMAVIQLKKVVAQNPRLLKAQTLLALLYIHEKQFSRAKKALNHVLKTDKNNTLALRYLSEIGDQEHKEEKDVSQSFLPKKRIKEREISDTSVTNGDVILPRTAYKEPSNGAITIINILVGVAIGAALIWFLIMPSRYKGLTADYNASILEYSEKLSSGNVELNSLQKQLDDVKAERDSLNSKVEELSGEGGSNKLLTAVIDAANSYIANDKTKAAEYLIDVDVSSLPTDNAKTLYNTIASQTTQAAATELYATAYTAYSKKNYTEAAENMVKAYKLDTTKADAAYYAAKSYEALSDTENAKKYYQEIVTNFPTSSYITEANKYIAAN